MNRISDIINPDDFSPEAFYREEINSAQHAIEFTAHQLLLSSYIVGMLPQPRAVDFANKIRDVLRGAFYELAPDNIQPKFEDITPEVRAKDPTAHRMFLVMRRDELLSFSMTICTFFHMAERLEHTIGMLLSTGSSYLEEHAFTVAHVSDLHDYLHDVIENLPADTEEPDPAWNPSDV